MYGIRSRSSERPQEPTVLAILQFRCFRYAGHWTRVELSKVVCSESGDEECDSVELTINRLIAVDG